MRVFLDTNVLVSAFTTRGICTDILNVVLVEHQLVLGESVLEELERVLTRKMRMPRDFVEEAEALLRREAVVASSGVPLDVQIRDPDDVAIVAQAAAGLSDVLVTGDKELLGTHGELPVELLSPRGFWEKLQAS